MVTIMWLVVALVISWIAMRSPLSWLKAFAGFWWFGLMIWIIRNPPMTAGSPEMIAAIVLIIGMGLMMFFMSLGREVDRVDRAANGGSITRSLFRFGNSRNDDAATSPRGQGGRESPEEYRRRVRGALGRDRRRRRFG
jgi:hypothetical protein